MKQKIKKQGISVIDLFCGAGGLTRGFLDAGLPVVAGFDLDPECQYAYEKNNQIPFILADVSELTENDLNKYFGDANVRVLAGCAPCQPFSTYTRIKDENTDNKWKLVNSFAQLITDVQPEIVTMENVPQLKKHKVFEVYEETLRRQGYKVWVDEVACEKYGVPQTRKRLVLLASLLGEIGPLEMGQHTETLTVKSMISHLEPIIAGGYGSKDRYHRASKLSPLNLERIQHSRPGGTWRDWPTSLIAPCHRKKTGETYPGVYGRMEWDKLAPTITTQCFGFGNGRFGHPSQDRAISLREAALLQTFPEDYEFLPPEYPVIFNTVGRMIGNAVPVKLAEAIGSTILNHVRLFTEEALDIINQAG